MMEMIKIILAVIIAKYCIDVLEYFRKKYNFKFYTDGQEVFCDIENTYDLKITKYKCLGFRVLNKNKDRVVFTLEIFKRKFTTTIESITTTKTE